MKHLLPLNESEFSYERKVKAEISYYGSTFNGKKIDHISDTNIDVRFRIYMDGRSWGIKDLSLYDITGPNEIELQIAYYPDDNDELADSVDETIFVKLDWSKAEIEETVNQGVLTVESVEIEVSNDPEGGMIASPKGDLRMGGALTVKKITVNVYKF